MSVKKNVLSASLNKTLPSFVSNLEGCVYCCATCRFDSLMYLNTDARLFNSSSQVTTEPTTVSFPDTVTDDTLTPTTTRSWLSSKTHGVRNGNPRFQCMKCMHVLKDASQHRRHMRMHHPERHACTICGKTFDYRRSLWEHTLNHDGKKKFPCPFADCGKTFARQSHLTDHVNWHTGSKPYACSTCHKQFRGKYTLSRHAKFCVYGQRG